MDAGVPCALEGDASLCLLRKATSLSYTHVSVALDQIQTQTDRQTDTHTRTGAHVSMYACMFGILGVSTQVQPYVQQPGQTHIS